MAVNPSCALLNQDVVYAILEHLTVPDASWYNYDTATRSTKSTDDTVERTATLARCGRVCKAFLFPATSLLWRNIDSIETLCALAQRSASQDAEVAVSACLSWLPTYAQYSRWVRVISNPSPISARSFQVTTPNDGFHLAHLPRLTHIRWVQEVPGTMDLLSILSPSLRSLHILFRNLHITTSYEHSIFVEALLVQAAERAPNLTYLRITRVSGIPEEWLHPMDQFIRLETLDISEPAYDMVTTCDILPKLAAMESLRSLKLRLPATTIYTASASDLGTHYFGALRNLHLDCKHASLHDAIAFLRAVSSLYLESVHVDDCDCPTTSLSASLLELCTVLHASFASTLRAISLSVTPIGPLVVFERPLVEYLEPLLHIRELAEFRLRISRTSKNVSMPASESDLAAIAEAWPHLTGLRLNCVPVEGPPAVRTLSVFARNCPLLTTLELPCIDARGVEEFSSGSGDPHLSLTSCGVLDGGWDSLIPDPEGLAQFLKRLFPNITLGRQLLEAEPWRRTVECLEGLRLAGEAF